jgi:hypothetical protein
MYQRKSGASCNCVIGELPTRENIAFQFASIAAAIPAEETSWLIALMLYILVSGVLYQPQPTTLTKYGASLKQRIFLIA